MKERADSTTASSSVTYSVCVYVYLSVSNAVSQSFAYLLCLSCLFACLPVCLFAVCLFVCLLSVCLLSLCLLVRPSVRPSVMSICLSVSPFVSLSICLSACQSICLCQLERSSLCPSIRPFVCLSVCPFVSLSVYLSAYQSVSPSICFLSVFLSVCLAIFPK